MKKRLYFFALAVTCVLNFTFCEKSIDNLKEDKDQIRFSLGINTKTEYRGISGRDNYQIDWLAEKKDKIRIFCDQADPGILQADYSVIRSESSKQNGTLEPTNAGLKWNKEWKGHAFYAVYPAKDEYIVNRTGSIVTFISNTNQVNTFTQNGDGSYTILPDMENAYMVAKTDSLYAFTGDKEQKVSLSFKPIMTTLDIIVKGRSNVNAGVAQISGVSITIDNTDGYINNNGQFKYNIDNSQIETFPINERGNNQETYFVSLKNSNGGVEDMIPLSPNSEIKLTVFLPPVSINNGKIVKIRVHENNGSGAFVDISSDIEESSKRTIKLSNFPNVTNGNNWITPLDDNIYVSQMSIPGAIHAASGYGADASITGGFEIQKEQMSRLWDIGVRAFDIRLYSSKDGLWTARGYYAMKWSFDQVINLLKEKLASNPGEFAIVFLRKEKGDTWLLAPKYVDILSNKLNSIDESFVVKQFKKDITIKEMRGKILFISRTDNDGNYNGNTIGAKLNSDWPSNTYNFFDGENNLSNGANLASMAIQDYYLVELENDQEEEIIKSSKKYEQIISFLEYSHKLNKEESLKNKWVYNDISCYHKKWHAGIANTNNYSQMSGAYSPLVYKYIKNKTTPGSTGIMMLSLVTTRTTITTMTINAYGDILPQLIIDNNYKVRMRRVGDR